MELKLPLVVVQHQRRNIRVWVPGMPTVAMQGPSLAEMRDDLSLQVMECFEKLPALECGRWQLPPQVSLRLVKLSVIAQDRDKRKRFSLEGKVGVLLEKWPRDSFWVVTPTRVPEARFLLSNLADLETVLGRRLANWCLEKDLENLDAFVAQGKERLDILEVDVFPPSILPHGPKLRKRQRRRKNEEQATAANKEAKAPAESEEDKETRRRMRRMYVRTLREVGRNLSHAAADGTLARAFGRENMVRELLAAFDGREGLGVVLLGPPGAGKSAVVREFVRRLTAAQGQGQSRRDVWRVDGNRFISGMSYVGQWEARARSMIEELSDLGDILYIEDLASMVYAGRTSQENTNVGQFLEAHLARGEITILAESTAERFEKVREEAPNFAALFRVVHVPPMNDRETLPVLLGVLRELEGQGADNKEVSRFDPAGLEAILHIARRFMATEAFPGKAVRLLQAVIGAEPPGTELGVDHVFQAVQRQTGLPPFILGNEAPIHPDALRNRLTALVAGQPEAVETVASVVLSMQHGLSDPEKPLATYLFVGPTGVGKTELCKALAHVLFGSKQRLVRFDMSEFASPWAITRLVGSAYAPDGELTTALRTQPFCVVLFDEIEKAHPRVFDALLQLLGEGRLTDAGGRTTDARQAVIVLTSNLGVREAASSAGFHRGNEDENRKRFIAAVRQFFRPEFFNRLDHIVAFRSLGPEALRVIVEHALGELLSRRGISRGNVLVDVEPALLDLLVEQAFDPRYGARPLRRALERKLAVPLAHHLVRRQSEDLAMVELYRRGGDMALWVRALRQSVPLPSEPDNALSSLQALRAQLVEYHERYERLRASAAVEALQERRAALLRGGGKEAHIAGIGLLDTLTWLRDEISELEEGDLAERFFVEQELGSSKQDKEHHNWGSKHNRPQREFMEVPVHALEEPLVRRAAPKLAGLRDSLDILELRLAAAVKPPEAFTLLVEPATAHPASFRCLHEVLQCLPLQELNAELHYQKLEVDGARQWVSAEADAKGQYFRACAVVRGPGVESLVEHLLGYALCNVFDAGRNIQVLFRLLKLPEPTGPEAVVAHDAMLAAARERRRQADEGQTEGFHPETALPDPIVLLGPLGGVMKHLASGLAAQAHEAVCARMIRASRGL